VNPNVTLSDVGGRYREVFEDEQVPGKESKKQRK
jgi:hypothetical protein